MIKEDKLVNVYECLISDGVLTTKKLNECGLSSSELTEMVKSGTLIRIKRGYYNLGNVDGLFHYGKILISKKNYEEANKCFLKCYELNNNHLGACFQLFFFYVQKNNYKEAFKYFDIVYNNEQNDYYKRDSNLYLYILNNITDIPEKYREIVSSLNYADIMVQEKDKRYRDPKRENKMRLSIFNKRYSLAFKQINELISSNEKVTFQTLIIKKLLLQVQSKQKKDQDYVYSLILNEDYAKVIDYLENKKGMCSLLVSEELILYLSKTIISIIKDGKIPSKREKDVNYLNQAIYNNDFVKAQEIIEENKDKFENFSKNTSIYALLVKINGLIKGIQEENASLSSNYEEDSIENIKLNLESGKYVEAFSELRIFLNKKNRLQYEFYIISLINDCVLNGDFTFAKPLGVLNDLLNDKEINLSVEEYYNNAYLALKKKDIQYAKSNIDIVKGIWVIVNSNLEQLNLLMRTNEIVEGKKNGEMVSPTSEPEISAEIKATSPVVVEEYNNGEIVQEPESVSNVSGKKLDKQKYYTKSNENIIQFKQLIESNYSDLVNNGVVLLKRMDNERVYELKRYIVDNYDDIACIIVGENKKNNTSQLALRYFMHQRLGDCSSLIKEANELYYNGQYMDSIAKYRLLLESFSEVKSWLYAKLGLCYLKIRNKELAIEYLKVATEVSKIDGGDFDYSDLILSLSGDIPFDDRKPHFKMCMDDFDNDLERNYGIDYIDEIIALLNSGESIDDIGNNYSLNDEDKMVILLIVAKKWYAVEEYIKGDKYVKVVEQSPNKTPFVKELLQEVRKNKKFYKNRNDVGDMRLTLQKKV